MRNDNSFFGGLMMSPRTKGFTLIFGNFEKDSLQPGKRGDKFAEHLLDLVTFEFARIARSRPAISGHPSRWITDLALMMPRLPLV